MEAVVLFAQIFGNVPGDGLPFPVRIRPQVDLFDAGGRLFQFLDYFVFPHDGDILRLEIAFHVHPQLVLGKVPDMALGGAHVKFLPQVLLEGPGLGGGLHNEKRFCHKLRWLLLVLFRDVFGNFQFYLNAPAMQAWVWRENARKARQAQWLPITKIVLQALLKPG